MHLLSEGSNNHKIAKNSVFKDIVSYNLSLAPYTVSGVINTCKYASKGCSKACLNTAGRGVYSYVQDARIRKTKLLVNNPNEFFRLLVDDIGLALQIEHNTNKQVVIRLNTTSDIPFDTISAIEPNINMLGKSYQNWNIFEIFPQVIFYDYTKDIAKIRRLHVNPLANYHLVFSLSESNAKHARQALQLGYRIAIVFRDKLPDSFWSYPVIDGDKHDLVYKHPVNCIVGLKAKGKAKHDSSGFVQDINVNSLDSSYNLVVNSD